MVQDVEKNGLGGKDSDDSYLKVSFGYGSSTYIDFLRYKDVSGAQDVAEFSVYIPSDGCGFTANIRITDKVTGNERYPLQFTKDGIYYAGSSTQLLYGWEPNKWYNVAIETPAPFTGEVDSEGNSLDSKKLNIYVNGSLVVPIDTFYTDIGYDQFRLISPSTNADTINAYLDNIRVYSGTYNPQYDVADNISYTGDIDADNNIFINGDTTVGELKANITKKTDTSIRVYQSITSTTPLSDSAYLDDGYVVVVSAKNSSNMDRTYSYYKIVKSMYTFKGINDGSVALSGKNSNQVIENDGLGGKATEDRKSVV